MPTPGLIRLTTNAIGMIIPCQNPTQNPAGSASGILRKAQKLEYEKDPEVRRQLESVLKQLVVAKFIEREVMGRVESVEPAQFGQVARQGPQLALGRDQFG